MSDRSSIIDTIEKDGKFATFARMLRSSKAVDLIAGAGPFTVFAPTNDAFGKVPDAQMTSWLSQTDQTDLAKVLSYHAVAAKLFASNLSGKGPTATLSGAEVTFTDTNGLKVNGSGILARNIEATNGIVHALDTVLTAPVMAATATAAVGTSAAVPTPAPTVAAPSVQIPVAATPAAANSIPVTATAPAAAPAAVTAPEADAPASTLS